MVPAGHSLAFSHACEAVLPRFRLGSLADLLTPYPGSALTLAKSCSRQVWSDFLRAPTPLLQALFVAFAEQEEPDFSTVLLPSSTARTHCAKPLYWAFGSPPPMRIPSPLRMPVLPSYQVRIGLVDAVSDNSHRKDGERFRMTQQAVIQTAVSRPEASVTVSQPLHSWAPVWAWHAWLLVRRHWWLGSESVCFLSVWMA